MIPKNFRFSVFIRVLAIVVLALLLAFVILREQMLFVPVTIALLLLAAIVNLIWHIEKSTRDLTHFLFSIRQGAFTESYTSANRGKPYAELSEALNEIIGQFARLNLEKELHFQYLQALNENISVAILSFNTEGQLLMMNPAAKRLLNLPSFSSIEHFKTIDPTLYKTITRIQPDERAVVKVFLAEEQVHLVIQTKEIMLQEKRIHIILLQNLNHELEAKETEAWHQLMRVLTHEIMNSVTPIVSLTGAIQTILSNADGTHKDLRKLNPENIDDVFSSLTTITSRSKGLLKFVNAYREYAKPLQVHLEPTDLVALVTRIIDLLTPDLQAHRIHLHFLHQPKRISVKADVPLIEQVLINLLKNAMEAVPHDGAGEIILSINTKANNNVSISIADNGPGIHPDIMPRIFIPFYTTKTKGTGIGLSLSRQIMKLHNGSIRVHSTPGEGSTFIMEWS